MFHHSAQGYGAAVTLGRPDENSSTLKGLHQTPRFNPFRVAAFHTTSPRVVATRQPWAGGWNAVGVRLHGRVASFGENRFPGSAGAPACTTLAGDEARTSKVTNPMDSLVNILKGLLIILACLFILGVVVMFFTMFFTIARRVVSSAKSELTTPDTSLTPTLVFLRKAMIRIWLCAVATGILLLIAAGIRERLQ